MGKGNLQISVTTGSEALPIKDALITIKDISGNKLYEERTNENGLTDTVSLSAPPKENSLTPNHPGPYYATYDVEVSAEGYDTTLVNGVQIFDTETSILPINMTPLAAEPVRVTYINKIHIPENALASPVERHQETSPPTQKVLKDVFIPDRITVHLGSPNVNAKNVTVPFRDYIKNVASSEIYPTWPAAALEANIYCHITFALNRIYTEWYTVRGYAFNITNSPAYDQSYVEGRNIFQNISNIVDNIFNIYVRRQGRKEPYFTQYCNGTTSKCPGLSQWGTVDLANQGNNPFQILRYYYANDIELVECDRYETIYPSYQGSALKEGDRGKDVQTMQNYLNRIRINFPLIPQIQNPNGVFESDTTKAVKVFQQTFSLTPDGIIGKGTWNTISSIYTAVKKLAELQSEGEHVGIGASPPTIVLREGAKGTDVAHLQFLLNVISEFYPGVPSVIENASFDRKTKDSVISFQSLFGLTTDGVVGPATWRRLYEIYRGIEDNVAIPSEPDQPTPPALSPVYPGSALRVGSKGSDVLLMQKYLNALSNRYPQIPKLVEDGIYGNGTMTAVTAFQKLFGLTPDGILGSRTWNKIVEEYNKPNSQFSPPYPGYLLRIGSRGDNVLLIQRYLNHIADSYPTIPGLKIDGIFGNGTQAAVLAFQKTFELTTDGIVGSATWNAIVNEYNKINTRALNTQSLNHNKQDLQIFTSLLLGSMYLLKK